jgi:hypothetical protein
MGLQMTDRVIDTERAGGTGNAAPRQTTTGAALMSLDEAICYHLKFEWRKAPTKGDQARRALISEIARLRGLLRLQTRDALAACSERDSMLAELSRLRAANETCMREVETEDGA